MTSHEPAASHELVRVVVRAEAGRREELVAALLELAPQGFEEAERDGVAELAVYADETQARRVLAAFAGATVEAVEPGWEDAWRRFHRPVEAGGLWIGPPWLRAPEGMQTVVIEPGRAFGTGAHATTRLCLDLLAQTERGSLLDVGCGSGVLAIAATRLGFAPVVAVDVDPVAVEVTLANAEANRIDVEAHVLDATSDRLPPADVAVVNVLLEPAARILGRVDARDVVTSGYLEHEIPVHPGWSHVARRSLEGWAADAFRRSP